METKGLENFLAHFSQEDVEQMRATMVAQDESLMALLFPGEQWDFSPVVWVK